MLKNLLTKRDALGVLELIQNCLACATANDFRNLFGRLGCLISYDFAVCGLGRLAQTGEVKCYDIVNINYPHEWIDIYTRGKYHLYDPVFKQNFSIYGLQWWAETYRINKPHKNFIRHANDFKLVEGYTCGEKNHCGDTGSLISISGTHMEHDQRTMEILRHLLPHLHQALTRIIMLRPQKKTILRGALSSREKDVINWIKQGKGSWEISVILGISERTVNFHVHRIMRKLDAVSRAQAVAIAVEHGLVGLD